MGWLKRFCLGASHELPSWVRVGVEDPDRHVSITLEGVGEPRDVTQNTVMVDLVPFVLALALPADLEVALRSERPVLAIRGEDGRGVGRIGLRLDRRVETDGQPLFLFNPIRTRSQVLPRTRRTLHELYQRWVLFNDNNPRNTDKMPPVDLFACWLLYSYPRPVSLLSFRHGDGGNMIPVDLTGLTDAPAFLVGLKHKKPGLKLLRESRDFALSTVPYEWAQVVYGLGRNHGQKTIDFEQIPFPLVDSPTLGIPVPREAVTVRELTLKATYQIAKHTMMVAESRAYEEWSDRPRLCHVPRIYQHALLAEGRAFPDFKRTATFDELVAAAQGGER